MKHLPFNSVYREDFEVIEQRQGNVTLFPHTGQLPVLLRALNLEFYGGLPARIARVDQRGSGFDKVVLDSAAMTFCLGMNAARPDALRLMNLCNRDLVAKIAIVQQITEASCLGPFHRFRFYAGEDFFPEIFLSGKRILFADHVLQRFNARVPNCVGTDLSCFLFGFFGSPVLDLPVGPGRALIVDYSNSILAFPFKESEDRFFITTCLTLNEIHSLSCELPPRALNFHYEKPFTRPKIRNWLPTQWMMRVHKCWSQKAKLPPAPKQGFKKNWSHVAHWVRDYAKQTGHGPGSRLCFIDHLSGPQTLKITPSQQEAAYDELKGYQKEDSSFDWETIFAIRYGEMPPESSQSSAEI